MSIRVIAGSAKGTRLKLVPGDGTRPIMDRVKESLFNILGRLVLDSNFLDLFAGTGSVGIEALSRGAAHALLLDIDAKAVRTIEENLQLTRLADRAVVRRQDAFTLLRARPEQAFDIIYIAPPQYHQVWLRALEQLDLNPGWLAEDGCVIVQIDPNEKSTPHLVHLTPTDERRYGNTLLWFFKHQEAIVRTEHEWQQMERMVCRLIDLFAITAPPIPIERMLQNPAGGLWGEIDPSTLSLGFFNVSVPFSPRMSLARFLARTVAASEWGRTVGIPDLDPDEPLFQAFARMLVMPAPMIHELKEEARTPALISVHFEVPEEDAARRLEDLRLHPFT
jgi:16S rRNA (guanine(966)-N(2))-methyltransferase RsmD